MSNNFVTTKLEVPIHNVRPNPFNPNFMDKSTFRKEVESVKQLGFIGSIIVRDHIVPGYYEILDGEHRWKACVELGYDKIQIETMGQIPDQQMKFLTVHLNNLHGKDDIFKRAAILKDLDEGQTQLLPWTLEEIENEKKLVSFDFSQYEAESNLPERTPGMLIVLPLNAEESVVWQAAKAELIERKLITLDTAHKKQDIQCVMYMIKVTLGITGKLEPVVISEEKIAELNVIADSYANKTYEERSSVTEKIDEPFYPGS